jgi:cytochrome c553
MSGKQSLKQGEKVLFGIFGAFFVAAILGYAALEIVRTKSDKPMFEVKTHYDFDAEAEHGSKIYRESGCNSCHRAMRNGTNMGLSLDGLGSKHTYEWIYSFLKNPEKTYGAATIDHGMHPKEAAYVAEMKDDDLRAIAAFLFGLKADRGSASAELPPEGKSQFIDDMVKMVAPGDWKERFQDVRELDDNNKEK